MSSPVAQALTEALASGYQIHPDAFRLLQALAPTQDIITLTTKAIDAKRQRGDLQSILTQQDLEAVLPPTLEETELREALERPELAPAEIPAELRVVKDPTPQLQPLESAAGFRQLFRSRFHKLLAIAHQRPDAHLIQKISTVAKEPTDTPKKVAGLVLGKRLKKAFTELTIDDETGRLTALASEAAAKTVAELSLDQLAILDFDFSRKGIAIIQAAYHPDIPDHKPTTAKRRVYAAFISDLQVGSKKFLSEAFQRFLLWLQGRAGDEPLVRRLRYLIIGGDAVDGIGVYPGQEQDLAEPDVAKQYALLAQLLEQVPKHISIVLAPGNHDPTREALPQPAIPRKYAEALYTMENITFVGNPAQLSLHGVKTLVYHGQSLYDVVATTPGLTFSQPAAAMKILLKARHVAPMYGGRTALAPEPEDHLVIEEVPDIFHAGHVHTVDAATYRGTLLLNSGTWQAQTRHQANMGIQPTPAIVPIVDLNTLDVTLRDFRPTGPAA